MVPVVTVIVHGTGNLSTGHTSVGIWLLGGVVSVGHCLLWSFALHRVAQCYNIQIFRKMSATPLFSKNFQWFESKVGGGGSITERRRCGVLTTKPIVGMHVVIRSWVIEGSNPAAAGRRVRRTTQEVALSIYLCYSLSVSVSLSPSLLSLCQFALAINLGNFLFSVTSPCSLSLLALCSSHSPSLSLSLFHRDQLLPRRAQGVQGFVQGYKHGVGQQWKHDNRAMGGQQWFMFDTVVVWFQCNRLHLT